MSDIDSVINQLGKTSVSDEKEVSFADRALKLDTEEDAKEIVQAIKNCPGMTTLRLEGNTFGIVAAKAIAKALESQPNFKRALWKDMFTQRTEHEIPDALNYLSSGITLANAHLVELDLSDNAFGPRGLKGIVDLLKSEPCFTLQELRLNNNGLGITGAKMLAAALSQCLSNSQTAGKPLNLKLFICGRNRLENEGSLALSIFLKNVGSLQHVAMPQNGIYYEGIKGLSEAFVSNPGLKFLSLEDNSLTEKGAKYLSKCLSALKDLEVLNLGDCLLRNKGAELIAKSLKENCPNLRELLVASNEIGKSGGLAIVNAVYKKSHLTKLDLNGNQFGEKTIIAIENTLNNFSKRSLVVSLSDDEGTEDEEENSKNPVSESDDDEGKENTDNKLTPETHFLCKPVSFAEFMADPTVEKLISLYETNTDILPLLPENPTLRDYLNIYGKISSIVELGNDKTEKAACHYADILLEKAYADWFNKDGASLFNNELLVALGLIKGEDYKPKSYVSSTGLFIVLNHAVRQKYFDRSTKDILQFFLSQPLKCGEINSKVKHSLFQGIFQ